MTSLGGVRLVTPEAVVLDLETAGVGSRMFARLIDLAIQLALLVAMFLLSATGLFAGAGSWAVVVAYLGVFAVLFGYPLLFELLRNGRTPGKAALGLRVVTIDGTPVRFRHALVRAAFDPVEVLVSFGSVGILAILFSRRNQRLGDVAGGTIVVHVRSVAKVERPQLFAVPHGCQEYVLHIDTARLSPELYTLIRDTLLRIASLPVTSRLGFANGVAATVASSIGVEPPVGMPAETWLVCIACAHRMRHPITDVQGAMPSWMRLAGDSRSHEAPAVSAAFTPVAQPSAPARVAAVSVSSQPVVADGYVAPG